MLRLGPYTFKRAETSHEFTAIHRLNYRTFVHEIPQHPDTGAGELVDKFHHKNIYFIILKEDRLVGMLSAHDQPPFSVADRLSDPSLLQRPGMLPLEVRLLTIEPRERNTNLFFGLIWQLYDYALSNRKTHLLISGVTDRLRLYQRLGFEPLGPAVACGQASFVPMILEVGRLPQRVQQLKEMWESRLDKLLKEDNLAEWQEQSPLSPVPGPPPVGGGGLGGREMTPRICLLPGPVTIAPAVQQAFHQPPIYHRGPEFIARFERVRQLLSSLVGGRRVALLNGSGTLANETVAATLAALPSPGQGVLLINGEFGERLARQALRFGLQPRCLRWEWGQPWNLDQVEQALATEPAGSWVWGVHQESSTGVLNDLPGLVQRARKFGIRVCVDCISSLGAVPLDLTAVFLATGSTGKALGSYAGGAIVFADPEAVANLPTQRVPSYFDLAAAVNSEGPCYTFPSPTLLALEAALEEYATAARAQATYQRYASLGRYVRQQLRELGLPPLAAEEHAAPVITTFAPPADVSALAFVERCLNWGIAIGGQSSYLAQRRLVQIATMGAVTREMCATLFEHLQQRLVQQPVLATA